MNKKTFSRLSP